eukprot:2205-Heterococcus_DN1.PRE.6
MASLGASSALLLCALPLLTAARCSSVRRTMRSFGLKACCIAVDTSTHILQCQSDCTDSSTPCFTATLVALKRAITDSKRAIGARASSDTELADSGSKKESKYLSSWHHLQWWLSYSTVRLEASPISRTLE